MSEIKAPEAKKQNGGKCDVDVISYQIGRSGISDKSDKERAAAGPLEIDSEAAKYITKPNLKEKPVYRMELATWLSMRQFFLIRGWKEWNPKDGNTWNLYWRENRVGAFVIKNCFKCQRINKFRDSNGITLKDLLALRMSDMREKHGSIFDFVPRTWVLPDQEEDLAAHVEKSSSNGKKLYICKPARLSRGRNIFLFKKFKEMKTRIDEASQYFSSLTKEQKEVEHWVAQEYLYNPFLISGYKFDLRLYVLVTSLWPLQAFIYKRGLVRFATSKYDLDASGDLFKHLTNSSINKDSESLHSEKGVVGKGCKWRLQKLMKYLKDECGRDTDLLWKQIKETVLLTLLPMVGTVPADPGTFEYFGFDVMLDENLRPYVIEVNSGPAMSVDMPQDKIVKVPMVDDMFNMLQLDKINRHPREPFPQYARRRSRTTKRPPRKEEKGTADQEESNGEEGEVLGYQDLDIKQKGDWDIIYGFSGCKNGDGDGQAREKGEGAAASQAETMGKKLARNYDTIKSSGTSMNKKQVSEKQLEEWASQVVQEIKMSYSNKKAPW
eukprot:jgi/Bigna1/137414/aug1.39_g12122